MSTELNKATLERKDKDELTQIANAMGGKPGSRARKAQIIDLILELAGVGDSGPVEARTGTPPSETPTGYVADPMAEARANAADPAPANTARSHAQKSPANNGSRGQTNGESGGQRSRGQDAAAKTETSKGADDAGSSGNDDTGNGGGKSQGGQGSKAQRGSGGADDDSSDKSTTNQHNGNNNANNNGNGGGDQGEGGGRKRRRRGRNRGDEADDLEAEPVDVDGYLDLRDDGYGFLRVNGALPSREDVYVSVKQVRQFGLRKGDHLAGAGRPANRSEKNPALVRIDSVNGRQPEQAVNRSEFDELTPTYPDQQIVVGGKGAAPINQIIDTLAPLGRGSRSLLVAPPQVGKTTALIQIVSALQANNPDLEVLVVMVDERPEEVTEMQRALVGADVVASTFDRPAEEHCAVAELTLERAKRRVEMEADVVVVLDGISRLARAYNTAHGKNANGVDTHAIFPAKRFFGAARNVEEGGSLTVIATVAADNGSALDQAILEEFDGTETMTLTFDRRAAEREIFPAINIAASGTRRAERIVGDDGAAAIAKLRLELAGKAGDTGNLGALQALLGQLK